MHALDCNVDAKTAATQLWRGGFSQPTKESLDSHVAYIHWSTACYEESLSIFLHLCDKRGTDCRTPALDEHTGHVCHAASVTFQVSLARSPQGCAKARVLAYSLLFIEHAV